MTTAPPECPNECQIAAAMMYRSDLLNGCRDLIAPQLFREKMFGDIASLVLLGTSTNDIRDRLQASGDYTDERITEELYGLEDLADLLDSGRVLAAVEQMTRDEVVTRQLAELPATDYGNAQRLTARHGRNLRYIRPWRRWLAWDGRRWGHDQSGEVERRAKHTVRRMYAEADSIDAKERRKELAKWAGQCEAERRITAIIALAWSEPGIPVLPDDLDHDPWLLNVLNGTIDLRTGELQDHNAADMLTKLAPFSYDEARDCPRWLEFLNRIMGGNDHLIGFLRRAIGYSLTGCTGERVLFILHGCGANGKSTFVETIRTVLGDYSLRTPAETLLAKRGDSIPNDIARLKGARFVHAAETEDGRRLAEALVKDITGNDTLSARFMRAEWFDFRPECKLWLATNHRPRVKGTDQAIWDRLRLVPFSVVIPESERDHQLRDKLEAEGNGILGWAVRGCLEWQRDGLGVPDEVRVATRDYRKDMDVIGAFVDECLIKEPTGTVAAKELYATYKAWCERTGERHLSQRKLADRLKERGFSNDGRTTSNCVAWNGFRLVTLYD